MKIFAGAVGGTVFGGLLGFLLATVLLPRLELQLFGTAVGATVGLIFGGGLTARHFAERPRSQVRDDDLLQQ